VSAYYNEIDPYCAEWLRNLILEGLIAPGIVDDRDIRQVDARDLDGFTQCHFFAGLGGWSYALRLAMYPDDRPVWTGSCPCQPFSSAGKGKASGDERHLWPEWFRLISAVRPSIIFGEQVEAAIGWGWLDLVHSDMEAEGYTVGATVLPACSVGAPHIRQRLWFVASTESGDREISISERRQDQAVPQSRGSSEVGELADSYPARCREGRAGEASNGRDTPRLEPTGLCANHWSNLIWLPCTDGKQRPTGMLVNSESEQVGFPGRPRKPGEANGQGSTQSIIQPLAHGVPGRVAKLRAAGNAIVPQVAAEFIKASMT
jgi:DNA (cytosine-5)-methyltransferase 1